MTVVLILWITAAFLFWIIANGSAFLGENPPRWRWPRAPAPEWETDVNGRVHFFFTWAATIMDLSIVAFVLLRFVALPVLR